MLRLIKSHFTLEEVISEWQIPDADLVYLVQTGTLRLAVQVFTTLVDVGEFDQTADGNWHRIPHSRLRHSGLLDLKRKDAYQILRKGSAGIIHFHKDHPGYCDLHDQSEPMIFHKSDLLVTRERKDHISSLLKNGASHIAPKASFREADDYKLVTLNEAEFMLGPIQARIVKNLHEDFMSGKEWSNGKKLLTTAQSSSMRMLDVFKSQNRWRELIVSDGRGNYRLNIRRQRQKNP